MKKRFSYTFKIPLMRKIGAFALWVVGISWLFFEPLQVATDQTKVLFNKALTLGDFQYTLTFYEHSFYPLLWFLLASLFAFSRKKLVVKGDHLFFKGTFMGLSFYTFKKADLSSYQEVRIVVGSQMKKAVPPMSNIDCFSIALKNNHTFTNLDYFESYQGAQQVALWLEQVTRLTYADYT